MATANQATRVVNGVNVDGLFETIDAIKAQPAIAKFRFSIQNQWKGASRNCSIVSEFFGAGQQQYHSKPFVLHADEPVMLLGSDGAANPVEHLLHALASCVTTSMIYHAAARGIQIQEVESSFEGDADLHGFLGLDSKVRKGFQGIRVSFKVKADVPDDQLQEIVKLGTTFSPVFDSVSNGVPITVSAERL